jgi:hypothetical protein
MPTPDEFSDAAKFHAQDLGRMRGAPKPRKPRGDKNGRTGWRAVLAGLIRPFAKRSQ